MLAVIVRKVHSVFYFVFIAFIGVLRSFGGLGDAQADKRLKSLYRY